MALNAGIYNALFGLRAGAPIVMMTRFDTGEFARLVERFAIRQAFLSRDALILHPLPDPRTDLFCIIWNYKIDRHGGLLLIWFCIGGR